MIQLIECQQDYQAIARELAQEFPGNAIMRDLEAELPTDVLFGFDRYWRNL